MWINVILSIDERLDDVKRCVRSLRDVYGAQAPIALATYGGAAIGEQPAVSEFAMVEGLEHVQIPRHAFLTREDSAEWHACEVLARLQITREFFRRGYDETYIMHCDVVALKDFRPYFREKMCQNWSLVALLLRARESFWKLCQKGSWELYFEGNRARLADILCIYNPIFVNTVYERYGSDDGVWRNGSRDLRFGGILRSSTLRAGGMILPDVAL
jgi:hypothetical protein